MQYIVIVVLMVLATGLDLSMVLAQSSSFGRDSLRGLHGVTVVIETIAPDAQKDGLTEDAVRTAVELILRSSGIRVFTWSENKETLSSPALFVNIYTLKNA